MIKVLHFFKTYYPDSHGGVEQVIFQLAEGGAGHGIDSQVLYLSPRGSARNEIVGSHRTHRSRLDLHVASTGFSLSAFRDFAELAAQADIVHYHFPWPFMDMVHFATRPRKPTVVTYHSDIVKQKTLLRLYRPLMQRFLGSVDRIVASSPNYVASSPVLARYADKVQVIPFGLDRTTYPPVQPSVLETWRARLGENFFLFVGALRYYKGLHILLDAVQGTGLPVVIMGGGALEADLRAQAARLGLDHVHFLGALPDEDKTALLALCRAVVFPSHLRSEAFGMSLLEGAMFGKPIICCEIGTGTTYINVDGETGLAVPPADPAALRQAMQRLWHDDALVQRMGDSARQRFDTVFSHSAMVSTYANLYRGLVQG